MLFIKLKISYKVPTSKKLWQIENVKNSNFRSQLQLESKKKENLPKGKKLHLMQR